MIYCRSRSEYVELDGGNGRIRPWCIEGARNHRSLYIIERPGVVEVRDFEDQTVVAYVAPHEIRPTYVTTPDERYLSVR
jgi:hypothetical protein